MDISRSQPGKVYAQMTDIRKLLVSSNDGTTWQEKTYLPEWGDNLPAIHVHSQNPNIVIAIAEPDYFLDNDKIYRSTDGGATWSLVDDWFVFGSLIVEDPNNPDVLYAGGSYDSGERKWYDVCVCKSYDGGLTWPGKAVKESPNTTSMCNAIAVAPGDSSLVVMVGDDRFGGAKVWRSFDGGTTWGDVTHNLSCLLTYGDYIWSIWISPSDSSRVLVGTTKGVYKSLDGGESWQPSTLLGQSIVGLACFAAMNELFALSGSLLYRSNDQGETWELFADKPSAGSFKRAAVDAVNGKFYFSTGSGGLWKGTYLDLPHLAAGPPEVKESLGGVMDLGLFAGAENASRHYLIVGSATGTTPGIPLPGGMATLPVNWDAFSALEMTMLNSPVFSNFLGTLNGLGNGAARLRVPPLPPGTAPATLLFAYCCNNPFDFASNYVSLEVVN